MAKKRITNASSSSNLGERMDKIGLCQVYTGPGKGKSTSALGLTFRALGRGWNVLIVQFLKGDQATDRTYGELNSAKLFSNQLKIIQSHKEYKIVMENNKTEEDKQLVESAWDVMLDELNQKEYDMLILDEILPTLCMKLISQKTFFNFHNEIKQIKPNIETVLTGRIWVDPIFDRIKDIADYMSDIKDVKHPFKKFCGQCKRSFEWRDNFCPNCGQPLISISARPGIEF